MHLDLPVRIHRVPTCDQALLHLDDHQSGARLGVAQVEAVRDAPARLQRWQITIEVRRRDADFGGALDDHRPDVILLKALGHLIDVPAASIHLHDPVALLQNLLWIARVPALDGAGMDRDDDGRQLVYHVDNDPEFAIRRASWRRLHGAHLRRGHLAIWDEAEPQLPRPLQRRQLGTLCGSDGCGGDGGAGGRGGGARRAAVCEELVPDTPGILLMLETICIPASGMPALGLWSLRSLRSLWPADELLAILPEARPRT
mmetsp:Transcript_93522/g.238069  ORF Transcript_93522/g.238069 Transcript_93522/m.238069 type:complete len:258 (-) Transcript_93522:84-857(-)|eukprot:CAMPEP_0183412676 /NCGR_PEP_ID=MMETSP0370-20130417/21181_1 /TAXON_ID=268820 /ORGANISM="Peridinium aciculiferum, Strain PAER-2" /LENGTH=257 /DNA_ID=CAMNT_0025595805 /DNA_START=170 /DNA_END=943 /DNA_ORIENTATION=+